MEKAPIHQEWNPDHLKAASYLQNTIRESLRLRPAIGSVVRAALQDTVLPVGGGQTGYGQDPIYVEKGNLVMFSFYAMQRRKDIFGDDAEVFRPERWETLQLPPWSFLPFRGGRRSCPGRQLALTEMAYATVQLVTRLRQLKTGTQSLNS